MSIYMRLFLKDKSSFLAPFGLAQKKTKVSKGFGLLLSKFLIFIYNYCKNLPNYAFYAKIYNYFPYKHLAHTTAVVTICLYLQTIFAGHSLTNYLLYSLIFHILTF